MSLIQNINLGQSQRLTMTPQLRQAISLLQMNNLQLAEFLATEIEKNPLLEPLDDSPALHTTRQHDFDQIQNIAEQPSLFTHLCKQIQITTSLGVRRDLAMSLAGDLDKNGFLNAPLFEIGERMGASQAAVEDALEVLQNCEPVGVGARDLRESLVIQLKDRGDFDPVMQVITDNLDLLANANHEKLRKLADLSIVQLDNRISKLRELNPRPAASFFNNPSHFLTPDVLITKGPDGMPAVVLNDANLPKLLRNRDYETMLIPDHTLTSEFVNRCNHKAGFLLRAMDQRAKNILKVAKFIVLHQNGFFASNVDDLRVLTPLMIAQALGIHESTVSRVISGKYLSCARGNFKMSHFMVKGVSGANPEHPVPHSVLQQKITNLIASERVNSTLSDEKLTIILKEQGINIARRTVAKYRMRMGIPSSSRRRKQRMNLVMED